MNFTITTLVTAENDYTVLLDETQQFATGSKNRYFDFSFNALALNYLTKSKNEKFRQFEQGSGNIKIK